MTYDETRAVLNVLFIAYPATFKGWKEDQYKFLTMLYAETFKNIPAGVVTQAIKRELVSNRTNFAPSIGEVVYQVKSLISVLDANTAWEEVCYIVRFVDPEKVPAALRGLDEISRKIVSSRDIQRMKNSSGALDSFRPTFYAAYNKAKDQKENAAVESGNLLSISSKERMLELGRKYTANQLEIKGDTEA